MIITGGFLIIVIRNYLRTLTHVIFVPLLSELANIHLYKYESPLFEKPINSIPTVEPANKEVKELFNISPSLQPVSDVFVTLLLISSEVKPR